MPENTTIAPQNKPNSFIMLRALVGIGIICALLIVLTYEGTKPRIKMLQAEALEQAIFKVLPGITQSTTFVLNENGQFAKLTDAQKIDQQQTVYAGYDDNNKLVGMAIEASGQGYAGVIRILYGYSPEAQQVIGFYVLESKETPGLGDKIETDESFLASVEALDVQLSKALDGTKNRVITVKDGEKENPWEINGISGATISSRAIGEIIASSINYWAPIIYQQKATFSQ